jgi:hypothetical protein
MIDSRQHPNNFIPRYYFVSLLSASLVPETETIRVFPPVPGAIWLDERDRIALFGDTWRRYRRRVWTIVPTMQLCD